MLSEAARHRVLEYVAERDERVRVRHVINAHENVSSLGNPLVLDNLMNCTPWVRSLNTLIVIE